MIDVDVLEKVSKSRGLNNIEHKKLVEFLTTQAMKSKWEAIALLTDPNDNLAWEGKAAVEMGNVLQELIPMLSENTKAAILAYYREPYT